MPRKTAYEHPVKGHTRGGVAVTRYQRGKGKKPKSPTEVKGMNYPKGNYNVSFWFRDGTRETFNVPGQTVSAAVRAGIAKIRQPKLPVHAQVRPLR